MPQPCHKTIACHSIIYKLQDEIKACEFARVVLMITNWIGRFCVAVLLISFGMAASEAGILRGQISYAPRLSFRTQRVTLLSDDATFG